MSERDPEAVAGLAFRIATIAESERDNQGMLGHVMAAIEPIISDALRSSRDAALEEAAKKADSSEALPARDERERIYRMGWSDAADEIAHAIRNLKSDAP